MIDPALVKQAEGLRMMLGAAVDTAAGFVTLHPDVQGEQLGDLIQQHFESAIERADELLAALAQAPAAPLTLDNGLIPGLDVDIDGQPWSEEGGRKMRAQDEARVLRRLAQWIGMRQFRVHEPFEGDFSIIDPFTPSQRREVVRILRECATQRAAPRPASAAEEK